MDTIYNGFEWPVEDRICVRCCKPNPCVLYQLCDDCHQKDVDELEEMRWLEELEDTQDRNNLIGFIREGY